MHLIETALQIALATHAGQQDKAGRPYILHPLRVMDAMQSDEERAVALLHDGSEDGDWDRARLIEAGMPAEVADAVEILSKRDAEDYPAFIERVLANPLASCVKRAEVIALGSTNAPCSHKTPQGEAITMLAVGVTAGVHHLREGMRVHLLASNL
jgi:hypothetical protein